MSFLLIHDIEYISNAPPPSGIFFQKTADDLPNLFSAPPPSAAAAIATLLSYHNAHLFSFFFFFFFF